jgi:hypothetical protein
MADEPISALPLFTSYSTADEIEILDVSDTTFASTGTNKRIQFSTLLTMAGVGTTATGDVTLAPGSSTQNVIQPTGDYIALAIEASASQTHHLQEWQNSSGTALAYVDSSGNINTPTVTATTGNISEINFGTEGGTIASPAATTLWTFQPTDPTKGPWQMICRDALFGTTHDSLLSIGYNTPQALSTSGVVSSEPQFHMNFEQDYWNSTTSAYAMEWYIEFMNPGSTIVTRPIAFTLNRATGASDVQSEIGWGDANYGQFQVTSNSVGLLTVTATAVTHNIATIFQGTVNQTVPNVPNGTTYYAYQANIGSDATLGPLEVGFGGIPSSSGSARKAFIYAGDKNSLRTLCVNSINGTSYGPMSAGTASFTGAIGVNGATPPAKAADPGTATSSDAAVINAIVTILKNLGFCS